MSKPYVAAEECVSLGAGQHRLEAYPNRDVSLGSLQVSRALPIREKRMVGPWCFLDRFGPMSFSDEKPMDVAPHPHIGLQTVTWLIDGEILHDDSLGSETLGKPGGVNVMTAGHGISHAEQTPKGNSGKLNGAQLWVALPEERRNGEAAFQAIAEVPRLETKGGIIQVFAGSLANLVSPARHFSDIVGSEIRIHPEESIEFGVNAGFEHALLVLDGDCAIEGQQLEHKTMYYLGTRRESVCLQSKNGGRVMLIGGTPFKETILMWWNFVARTPEEIAEARTDWMNHRRFGPVDAYKGPRLEAPDLLKISRPNPMS